MQQLRSRNVSAQELQGLLEEELDKITGGPSLCESVAFKDVKLKPKTIQLQKRNPQGIELQKLNRLVVEDAYLLKLSRIFARQPQDRKEVTERIINQLTKLCRESTARYLGEKYGTPGFYPQAFRHILATGIIKATGSYEEAALLLWDAVETVRRAYAHIKRVEQLSKASRANYERISSALQRSRARQLQETERA